MNNFPTYISLLFNFYKYFKIQAMVQKLKRKVLNYKFSS